MKKKMKMNKEVHYVELVGIIMPMMNSGFAVIFVKDGSMESA